MDVKTFNEKYFNEVISKITDEKKVCYLAGDFNIDLLKSETNSDTKDFFDSLTSYNTSDQDNKSVSDIDWQYFL